MNVHATIEAIFKEKVSLNELFTSDDLASQLKSVKHDLVSERLHTMWSTGKITKVGYTRNFTKVKTNNGLKDQYVYLPKTSTVAEYEDCRKAFEEKRSAELEEIDYDDTPTKTTLKGEVFTRHPRADGALVVPKLLIQRLGGEPGDALYGWVEDNVLLVSKEKTPGAVSLVVYKRGGTRIHKQIVVEFFPHHSTFSLRVVDNILYVA